MHCYMLAVIIKYRIEVVIIWTEIITIKIKHLIMLFYHAITYIIVKDIKQFPYIVCIVS